MPDPLAGYRERINEHPEVREIDFPDPVPDPNTAGRRRGRGCPVKRGDIFKLRTCHIEITSTRRLLVDGRFVWRAEFVRSYADKEMQFLHHGAGDDERGYTSDPDFALAACDDPDAATIVQLNSPRNLGPPPEPESIPSRQVAELPTTVAAQARFAREQRERASELADMSIPQRLEVLRDQVRRLGSNAERWHQAKATRGRARRDGRATGS